MFLVQNISAQTKHRIRWHGVVYNWLKVDGTNLTHHVTEVSSGPVRGLESTDAGQGEGLKEPD